MQDAGTLQSARFWGQRAKKEASTSSQDSGRGYQSRAERADAADPGEPHRNERIVGWGRVAVKRDGDSLAIGMLTAECKP